MTRVDISRVKSFYKRGKETASYDIDIGESMNCIRDISREELIELYHSIAAFFKEVEKEELK